ncbi:MAG: glucoamylase family protein, partial [Candidatus Omnitrophica bacterium]|nr:glucoamylase family protein [Candidatus Omnitrophota bacterium]
TIDGTAVSSASSLLKAAYASTATVGTHAIVASVSDGTNTAVTQTWTLVVTQTVNSAPVISSYSPTLSEMTVDLTVGGSASFSVVATDADNDTLSYTWTFDGSALSASSSALTSSAYLAAAGIGDHIVKVSVSDGTNTAVTQTWTIHVIKTNQAPVIASYSPSSLSVNVDLATETLPDFSITVTDRENDTLAYSWTIDGTAVSSASSLLKAAYASTATVGTHAIVASVSDGTNTAVTQTWALVVTDSTVVTNNPPVIASYVPATTAVSATVSAGTVNFSVAATDADGDNLTYKWTVDGSATSNTTSNYVFTVLSAGTHVVTASVTDNKIASTEEPVTTWNITIAEDPVNNSPEITAHTPGGSSFSMTSGNSQVFSVTATDLDSADTLTYAWTVDGVTVGTNSNSYTYAPSTEGAYAIKVTVTDGKIATPVYQAWAVTVGARDVLNDVSAHAFKYFWNEADTTTGLVRDRLLATSSTPSDDMYYDRSSVAATGFGLAALAVAAENYSTAADSEWTVTPEAIADRVEATLDTLLLMQASQSASGDATWGKDGFLYHFVNMSTGTRFSVESEVSTIDTALAVAGALTAGEYFKTIRPAILTKANQLYANVNWKAFLDTTAGTNYNRLYKAWLPDGTGFGSCGHWDYTDESLLLYLLAIGSPATSHAIDPDCYYSPTKDMGNYNASGKPIVMSWFGSLFTYQFAQSFFDFRGMHDARGVNWWQNSIDATIANRQFCLDNSAGYNYGEYVWGLSSEYGSGATYLGDIGAKPLANASGVSHCGFVNPLAVAASIGMLPDEVTATLKSMTEDTDLWLEDSYGFVDSFKDGSTKLYSDYFVGIDLGAAVLMLSNYNDSSLVWNKFMGATTRYGDMRDLLTTLGFKSDTDTARYVDVDDITAKSQFMYGYVDSSNPTAQIKVNLSEVTSDKDYLLAIHTFMNNYAGDHSVVAALTINGTAYGSRTFTHVTDVDDSIAYIEVPGSLLNVGENTIAFTWVSGASWLACKNIEFTSPVTTNEWTVVRSEYASEYRVDDTYYATHADSSKYGTEAYKTFAQALNISTKPYTDILFYADDLTHNRTLLLSQMYADGTVYVDVLVNDQTVASNVAFGDSQQVTIPAGVMNNGWNRITLKIVSGGGEWIVWNTISCATGGLASTAVPKDLVAASYGTDKTNLRWSAVNGTNVRYNIYRGTSTGGSYTKINSSALTSPAYQDSGLTGSMTYYYVVTAFEETNPTAETAYSTEASKATGAYDLDYGDGTDPNAFGGTSGSQFTYLSMIKHNWLTGYVRKLVLPAGDTATIGLNGADVSQAGVLSLWINSVSGGEKIKIGLSSSSSSVSSVAVTAAAGWQNVKIKLSEFSGLSSNSLSTLYVISDSTSAATLYLDDIQFIKSTTSSATLEVSVKNVSDNSRSSGISFTTSSSNDYAPANQYLEVTCASDSAKNWKVWIYTNNTNGNSTAMNGYYNGLMRSDGKARLPLLWRVYPAVQPSGVVCATSSDVYSGSALTWNYLLDKNDTNWASSNTTGAEYSVVCYGKYNEWAWLSQVPPGSGNRGTVNDKMYIYLGSILAGASAGDYSAAIYLDITHE